MAISHANSIEQCAKEVAKPVGVTSCLLKFFINFLKAYTRHLDVQNPRR